MACSTLVAGLYTTFAGYASNEFFNCTFCYDDQDRKYFSTTPLADLSVEASRKMLWETGDHWADTQSFKSALPRILEILGPPHLEEDLYPTHILETLRYHGFQHWPEEEQHAVTKYLTHVSSHFVDFDETDWREWRNAYASISFV